MLEINSMLLPSWLDSCSRALSNLKHLHLPAVRIIASLVKHSWLGSVSPARWGQAEIREPLWLACCTCDINSPEEESAFPTALVKPPPGFCFCGHIWVWLPDAGKPRGVCTGLELWTSSQWLSRQRETLEERASEGREFFYFLFIFVGNKLGKYSSFPHPSLPRPLWLLSVKRELEVIGGLVGTESVNSSTSKPLCGNSFVSCPKSLNTNPITLPNPPTGAGAQFPKQSLWHF